MEDGASLGRWERGGDLKDSAIAEGEEAERAVFQEKRRIAAEDLVVLGGFVSVVEDEPFVVALADESEGVAGGGGVEGEDLVEVGDGFFVDEGGLAGGGGGDVGDVLAVCAETGGGNEGMRDGRYAVNDERVFAIFGTDEEVALAVGAEGESGEFAGVGFGLAVDDGQVVVAAGGEVGDVFAVGGKLGGGEGVEGGAFLVVDDHAGLAVG